MTRRRLVLLAGTILPAGLLPARGTRATEPIAATLYKNPECSCCETYAEYLGRNGFQVDVRRTSDLAEFSRKAEVPAVLEGCHTMFVGGYVVDGHVPVKTIRRLFVEKPSIAEITLPGMPPGSPGMEGEKGEPLVVFAISKDGTPPRIFDVA
jgi:hypothetical protein